MLNLAITQNTEKEENKVIVSEYRRLLRLVGSIAKNRQQVADIRKAFKVALDAHNGTRRKSGEPFVLHPIAVAQIVAGDIGLDHVAVMCALLHDVVEDTEWELTDIKREFGETVTEIIDGLTKISGLSKQTASQQAENFRKVLLTLSNDVRVIIIKIADRLHNMRTLDSMPRNKQLRVASETIYFYAPLAHRLGLFNIKSELEDLYLKHTDPIAYDEIESKLKHTRETRERFIRHFVRPIEQELRSQGFEYQIKTRPKSIYSIYQKMVKRGIGFEDVYDLFAIRIILHTAHELEKISCWQVYSIVTDFYKPNPERLRDWLSTPKSNGYESLHTTVMSKSGQWVEVQIRSSRMDEIAEKGYAAHWMYKENTNQQTEFDNWLTKVREMLSNNDTSALDFINDFRSNLFADEVTVFTPKGELKTLPAGSTVLDFAFEIHNDIGLRVLGAKVNHKLVSYSSELKNGDQVEIIVSQKIEVTPEWLNSVKTSKAATKIRNYLKENTSQLAEIGTARISNIFSGMGIDPTAENLKTAAEYFGESDVDMFLRRMGEDAYSESEIKNFAEFYIDQSIIQQQNEYKKSSAKELLLGDKVSEGLYHIADCCHPIPGDDVVGFQDSDGKIIIHRTTCETVIGLMANFSNQAIRARWNNRKELAFLAGLKFLGTDRPGVVFDLTSIIGNFMGANIKSIHIDTEKNVFEGRMMIYVKDTAQLNQLIEGIKSVKGVIAVSRFDEPTEREKN